MRELISLLKIIKKESFFSSIKSILYKSMLFSFFLVLFSCNESTKPETVTFSGTVALEGETDFSEVKVSLYKPVELDTALVRVNQQYPNIGVQISQETEFDHREHSTLYSTTTNASGGWEIKDVAPGTYNVVAEKDSFGWDYNFVANNSQTSFLLYKEIYLSGIISTDTEMFPNHHYVITNDLVISNNVSLLVNEGVWIRVDGFYKIEISGSLNINGDLENYVHFTTNEDSLIIGKWRFIEGDNVDNIDVNFLILNYSKNGIRIRNSSNISIKNSIVRKNSLTGIHLYSVSDSYINNCILVNNEQSLLAQYNSNNYIDKSIFINSVDGIKLEYSDNQIIENYFEGHHYGIHSQLKPNSSIKHNEFFKNTYGSVCTGCDPIYSANNFNFNNVSIWIATEYFSINSKPDIKFNNFENNEYAVKMTGSASGGNIHDIDATNNWWGTSVDLFIQDLIWDKHDEGPDSIYTGEIFFIPYKNSKIDTAGIVTL